MIRWLSLACAGILIGCIYVYRYTLSPFVGGHCRFSPSCSQYALEAIRHHGPWKGVWLVVKRLGRCHPFCAHHGYDPIPEPKQILNTTEDKH